MGTSSPSRRLYFVQGVIIALAGAVCFSTKAIFVKLAYRDTTIDALTLLALRMVFSIPFFAITAFASSSKSTNVKFTLPQWLYIAVIGCLGYYISSLLDFLGLQFVSAGIERLILFIYPTLVLLMSSLIFKTKIKPLQWLALVITYGGLSLAFFNEVVLEQNQTSNFLYGSLLIFVCAFTYAAYIVGSGRLIPQVGATKFNSYAMGFASIGVLLHFFIGSSVSLFHLPLMVYVYSFLMAIFSTVIPSYLVTASINRIGANNAAIVGSVGPVSTILLAYIFLNESVTVWQLAGTAMILIGVFIISRQK
ncbi:MAG: DMT family transporter [Cyclobacteriaceae bacterium]|nr:DMT family transporter [Cyclobacteriaceae bacterium]